MFLQGDLAGVTGGTCDLIEDFSAAQGDRIRLNLVDANNTLAGDQNFKFLGNSGFSGKAGELRYLQFDGDTFLQGDVNGDASADFLIRVEGLHVLTIENLVI